MFQQMTIVGNLGNDPEMRFMPDGTAVTNFSVATNRRWKDENGDPVDETCWFRCSAWGRTGEVINEFFEKGKPILIVGRMIPDPQTGGPRIYQRQDGSAGSSFELRVLSWSFLPSSREEGSYDGGGHSAGSRAPVEEDEIPF